MSHSKLFLRLHTAQNLLDYNEQYRHKSSNLRECHPFPALGKEPTVLSSVLISHTFAKFPSSKSNLLLAGATFRMNIHYFFLLWKSGTQIRRRIPANSSSFGGPCLKGTICCQRTKPNKTQHKSIHMSSQTYTHIHTGTYLTVCLWKIGK